MTVAGGKTATRFQIGDRVKLVKLPDPPPGAFFLSKLYLGSRGTVARVVGDGFYHVDLGVNRPIFVADDSMLEVESVRKNKNEDLR